MNVIHYTLSEFKLVQGKNVLYQGLGNRKSTHLLALLSLVSDCCEGRFEIAQVLLLLNVYQEKVALCDQMIFIIFLHVRFYSIF